MSDTRSPYHIYHRSPGCQKIVVYPQGSNLRDVRVFVNWNAGNITVYGNIDSAISHFPMVISLPPGVYDQSSFGFNVFGSEQIVIELPFAGDGAIFSGAILVGAISGRIPLLCWVMTSEHGAETKRNN
ncbi:hypothetical protein SO802_031041 [Lithocarpus litseifolius]|uniref:Uncharacterized protein n=1 Tax=Lithocarpus litseifolius TaxID=425828 RepID=A0AAW2BJC5_9ROSI